MDISPNLLAHNVISVISIIVISGIAFFTYLNGPKKTANIAMTLMLVATAIFTTSHVIGVNISDPHLSMAVLMCNLSVFYIASFNFHAIAALTGTAHRRKFLIILMHSIAVIFTIIFLISPELFLEPSVPKMYFPNYYEPGPLNWIRVAFVYVIALSYSIYVLAIASRQAKSLNERKQYIYLIVALVLAYIVVYIPNFLIYDVPIDPLWGMTFSGVFLIPFTYGAVRYGLFSIKVVAIQAFFYSIAVTLVGGFIIFFNYLNTFIQDSFPSYPVWITPLVSSMMAVTAGVIIWRRLRESDILKYEFVTTVTHKFRTPLTHIKWAAENLSKSHIANEDKKQVDFILNANSKLVELTGLLANVSEDTGALHESSKERTDVSRLVSEVADSLSQQYFSKHIGMSKSITPQIFTLCDASRIRFVIQTLIENAFHYTPAGGSIDISVQKQGDNVTCSVKDSGIGISQEEMPFLFSKFYRGENARHADTEGVGIGLFIARQIIAHHHGKIWVESAGKGMGATFTISLTIKK